MKVNRLAKLAGGVSLLLFLVFPLLGYPFTAKDKVGGGIVKADYQEKLDKTYPLSPKGKVILRNVSGDIEVTSWDKNEVRIIAIKYSKAATKARAKENADRVKIKINARKDLIRISTSYPKFRGFFHRSLRVWVDYKLFVPRNCSLDIHTVSGDMDITAVMGELILESVSGDIAVEKGGSVDAESVSGDIELRGVKEVDASTVSGDIEAFDTMGDLRLKSVSGDITGRKVSGNISAGTVSGEVKLFGVSDCRKVKVGTTSGEVAFEGRLTDGGTYIFSTTSGDISLILSKDSSFDLDAHTMSGSIRCSVPMLKVSFKKGKRKLVGTAGKGGATLRISSTSGDIDIETK